MWRKDLPWDQGMLFKFPNLITASFWGKNTYIPLDIAFISKEGKILEIKEIAPMSTKPVYSSDYCAMAVETNAGFFKSNGINPGHSIKIEGNNMEFIC